MFFDRYGKFRKCKSDKYCMIYYKDFAGKFILPNHQKRDQKKIIFRLRGISPKFTQTNAQSFYVSFNTL